MKKSFMTRVLAVSLSAAMAFSLSSATSLTAPEAATKKLPANAKKATVSLKVGKSTTLKLKSYSKWNITKAKSNKTKVAKATLNKKAKATVKVTAKKKGTAVVTLTLTHKKNAKDPIKKKVTVKVTKAASTDTTTDTTPTDTTPTETPTDSAVKVTPGALNISSVTATKVDTLVVSFSSVVASTGAVKFTLTKGEGNVVEYKDTIEWNADANTATITTTAKMTKGTYTVSATDGKDTTTGTVEITDQEVKEIKFLNETALTGANASEAYIYYDVVDQYGESMRDTVSIQWTASSGGTPTVKRDIGKIIVKKNSSTTSGQTFVYGDKIYLTGVYTKTGVSNSGTFSVGTAQSVDTVNFAGFRKKGETTISEKLPAGFKSNQYELLYNVLDQNGNELEPHDYYQSNSTVHEYGSLTFISDNVLVVSKVDTIGSAGADKTVTVGGKEYCAVNVVPGDDVNKGGTVNISAISTKTGVKSTLNFVVGEYKILKKFEIGLPSTTVADGELVELPFTATDAEGNSMTNFEELANQSDFSKLSFSAGSGTLKLEQKDDGAAKLVWYDNYDAQNSNYWNAASEDGIDRPISLTAIVVGGETSNQMLYVSDKARPDAISDVDMGSVFVTGNEQKLTLSNFTFLDQYGRNMTKTFSKDFCIINGVSGTDYLIKNNTRAYTDGTANKGYVYDNGFFYYLNTQGNSLSSSSQDFKNYRFYIAYESSGLEECLDGTTAPGTSALGQIKTNAATTGTELFDSITDQGGFTVMYNLAKGDSVEPTIKFMIRRAGTNGIENVSTKLTKTFKAVNLNVLTNFSVADMKKWHVETNATDYETGDVNGTVNVNNINSNAEKNGVTTFPVENADNIKVTAVYNGTSVEIPERFYGVDGKILTTASNGARGDKKIATTKDKVLKWNMLYDGTSARYTRKDAVDTLTVTVQKQSGASYSADKLVEVEKTAYISDDGKRATTFAAADSVTIGANATVYTMSAIISDLAGASTNKVLEIKNQYDELLYKYDNWLGNEENKDGVKFTYLVKNPVESEDGFVKGNFKIDNNATANTTITGAELGDKFTLEITAESLKNGKITKTVNVTVGHDGQSYIAGSTNQYKEVVRPTLQNQLNNLYSSN